MPEDTVAVSEPAISAFVLDDDLPTQEPVDAGEPDQFEVGDGADAGDGVAPDVAETEPERPNLAELLKGLSDDDLEALPEVKSLVARKGESARQKAEREALAKASAAQQRYLASGEAFTDLQRIAAEAAQNIGMDGLPEINRDQANRVFNTMLDGGSSAAIAQVANVLNEAAGDGFALTQAEADAVSAAQVLWAQNRLDPSPLMRAWLAPYERAVLMKAEADITKTVEAKVRKEYEAKAKLDTAKAASDERKSQPGATVAAGGAPATPTTGNEFETAAAQLSKGSMDERRAALQRLVPGLTI